MHTLDEGGKVMKSATFRKGLAAAGLVAAVIGGCAAGGARLDRSQEAFKAFNSGQVTPGYRYYTTGMENNPDAILGLSEEYTLKTERWRKREMTPEFLSRLVGQMNSHYGASSAGLLGSNVLNDEGEVIGVWYSIIGQTAVTMVGDREVVVSPPHAIELQKHDPVRGR